MTKTKVDYFNKTRKILLGSNNRKGILPTAAVYIILTALGFTYFVPVLRMIVSIFMTPQDLVDPKVIWVPTEIYLGGFLEAFRIMDYWQGLYVSVVLSVGPALLQTLCTACVGYAFGRFEFPLRKFWIAMVVLFYIVPTTLTTIPQYLMFMTYGLLDTQWAVYLPAILGQGLKNGIFILIFFTFFSSYPKALDEAAEIDGCGRLRVFTKIALPMSGPAMVISIIFSVVWYWNETAKSSLLFGQSGMEVTLFGVPLKNMRTLPMRVAVFISEYSQEFRNAPPGATVLAAAFLAILPILIMYFILQKRFVESVERSGITGE